MLRPTKTLVACLTLAVALLASVTTTSANNISQTSRTFRATWAPLRITDQSVATVSCNVTLEGSFHSSSIRKVSGAPVGYVTRAQVGSPCTGGTATLLTASLPWSFKYAGFEGTLPRISGIQNTLAGFGISVDPAGELLGVCLAESGSEPLTIIIAMVVSFFLGVITGMLIYAFSGRLACGLGEISFARDTGTVTVLNSTSLISVRLI